MICTYLICYLWTQGGVKLTKEYTLYPAAHAHHRPFCQMNLITKNLAHSLTLTKTFPFEGKLNCVCLSCYLAYEASC